MLKRDIKSCKAPPELEKVQPSAGRGLKTSGGAVGPSSEHVTVRREEADRSIRVLAWLGSAGSSLPSCRL